MNIIHTPITKLHSAAIIIVAIAIVFATTFSEGLSSTNNNNNNNNDNNNNNNNNNHYYSPNFAQSRAQMLNLLNHPLQIQLATGDLPLGSFQRIVKDRLVLLTGIQAATAGLLLEEEDVIGIKAHQEEAAEWLEFARAQGKTIVAPSGIACYTCGGDHFDIDCPEDQQSSQSVLALNSVLQSSGVVGAISILEGYSFACRRLLEALRTTTNSHDNYYDTVYHGWLKVHAERWSQLSERCHKLSAKIDQTNTMDEDDDSAARYTACLSMFYNWIDMEAATTGIRANLNNPEITALMEALEVLEPGYATQRDKHSSFVACNISGAASSKANVKSATAKVDAATAYLAAKKKKEGQS